MRLFIIALLFAISYAQTVATCDAGYEDKTDGNAFWWSCGRDCEGGAYWADVYCNCACVVPSIDTLDHRTCSAHSDCTGSTPFCYSGRCSACSECHYCRDGIDGTCGPCGDNFPTLESSTCGSDNTDEEDDGFASCAFTFTNTRGGGGGDVVSLIQLAEVLFYDSSGSKIDIDDTEYDGLGPYSLPVNYTIDGDFLTSLRVKFKSRSIVNSYALVTGHEDLECDPISWTLECGDMLADGRENVDAPLARKTRYATFPIRGERCYEEYWDSSDCSGFYSFLSVYDFTSSQCVSMASIYDRIHLTDYVTSNSQCVDSECTNCTEYDDWAGLGPGVWFKDTCYACSFVDNCYFKYIDCPAMQQYTTYTNTFITWNMCTQNTIECPDGATVDTCAQFGKARCDQQENCVALSVRNNPGYHDDIVWYSTSGGGNIRDCLNSYMYSDISWTYYANTARLSDTATNAPETTSTGESNSNYSTEEEETSAGVVVAIVIAVILLVLFAVCAHVLLTKHKLQNEARPELRNHIDRNNTNAIHHQHPAPGAVHREVPLAPPSYAVWNSQLRTNQPSAPPRGEPSQLPPSYNEIYSI